MRFGDYLRLVNGHLSIMTADGSPTLSRTERLVAYMAWLRGDPPVAAAQSIAHRRGYGFRALVYRLQRDAGRVSVVDLPGADATIEADLPDVYLSLVR